MLSPGKATTETLVDAKVFNLFPTEHFVLNDHEFGCKNTDKVWTKW